jgi:hypothetical protein
MAGGKLRQAALPRLRSRGAGIAAKIPFKFGWLFPDSRVFSFESPRHPRVRSHAPLPGPAGGETRRGNQQHMNAIELSPEEAEALGQLLQDALASLDLEIIQPDHNEFREALVHRRDILRELMARLQQSTHAAA